MFHRIFVATSLTFFYCPFWFGARRKKKGNKSLGCGFEFSLLFRWDEIFCIEMKKIEAISGPEGWILACEWPWGKLQGRTGGKHSEVSEVVAVYLWPVDLDYQRDFNKTLSTTTTSACSLLSEPRLETAHILQIPTSSNCIYEFPSFVTRDSNLWHFLRGDWKKNSWRKYVRASQKITIFHSFFFVVQNFSRNFQTKKQRQLWFRENKCRNE